jgi:hypothetical protein
MFYHTFLLIFTAFQAAFLETVLNPTYLNTLSSFETFKNIDIFVSAKKGVHPGSELLLGA